MRQDAHGSQNVQQQQQAPPLATLGFGYLGIQQPDVQQPDVQQPNVQQQQLQAPPLASDASMQ